MESKGSHLKNSKDYWAYLEENHKEVSEWPTWMRGEASQPPKEDESNKEELGCADERKNAAKA
jgi:hypothetical protein